MKSAIRTMNAMIIPSMAVTALALGMFAAPALTSAQETAALENRSSYCCLKRKKVGKGRVTRKCYVAQVATRTHQTKTSRYWTVLVPKPTCRWVQE